MVRRYIVGCVLLLLVWPTFSIRARDEFLLISLWRIVDNRAPIANRNSRKFYVTVEKLSLSLSVLSWCVTFPLGIDWWWLFSRELGLSSESAGKVPALPPNMKW